MRQDLWPPEAWPKKLLKSIYYLRGLGIHYWTHKKPEYYLLELPRGASQVVRNNIKKLSDGSEQHIRLREPGDRYAVNYPNPIKSILYKFNRY